MLTECCWLRWGSISSPPLPKYNTLDCWRKPGYQKEPMCGTTFLGIKNLQTWDLVAVSESANQHLLCKAGLSKKCDTNNKTKGPKYTEETQVLLN